MQESWEGYGKNWMHFVYKTDNLLWSIMVSYGNSSVTKGFHFFWTYLNSIVFLCSKCTIQRHIKKFQAFLTSFVIFMHLLIILSYKTLKLKSISNELWKGWKLAWYHDPHIMCKKLERVTTKTGCTSCINWSLFWSIRVSDENSSVTKAPHFLY